MIKSLFFKTIIALIAVVSFQSCDNEPIDGFPFEDGDLPTTQETFFRVDIDGERFTATTVTATRNQDGLTILALRDDDRIQITLPSPSTGEFDFTNIDEATLVYDPNGNDNIAFAPTDGRIAITVFDTQDEVISGNFEANLEQSSDNSNTVQFTNGVFRNVQF